MSTINSNGTMVFGNSNGGSVTIAPKNDTAKNYTITIPDTSGSVALVDSPTFTGTPTAPTAASGTNTTQLATTAFAMGAGIGSNQTWQNVTGSRALGTTYTNSTGKPIIIAVTCSGTQTSDLIININGSGIANQNVYNNSGQNGTVYGIIPNNSTYSVTISDGSVSGLRWTELR